MLFSSKKTFTKVNLTDFPYPNYWDAAAILLVLGILVTIAWGIKQIGVPYQIGETISISLNPIYLPYYALRSVLRMLIAMIFSLLFTLVFGTLAAKSKHAERLIVPSIDVLQSVPVLSFLSITILGFIAFFHGSMWGPECAAIFAIFTSQVWNMTLSFYQSLRTVPHDLIEASSLFHLSFWQRFWRLDVPFAMPSLLWNVMVSMSASWFFVVAAEAITVANQSLMLPGIGSYIALAVSKASTLSVFYAILTMLIVIILYDQLLFRPLNNWGERFKFEHETDQLSSSSWLINIFQHTRLVRQLGIWLGKFWEAFVNIKWFRINSQTSPHHRPQLEKYLVIGWYVIVTTALLTAIVMLMNFIFYSVTLRETLHVSYLGLLTGIRVIVLVTLCSLIWVPIGIYIGLRPRYVEVVQPIIQILAAFPANLFFPIVVMLIVNYHLNVEVWVSPLMVLGTQWYILFNVIAGASALPKELQMVANNFNVSGWVWWRRIALPGIFPYFLTGAITAAGGAWNASIIAEAVSWGNTKLIATGLGAYITEQATRGDFPRVALGTGIMCLFVILINRLFWKPLYNMSQEKFRLS